MTDTDWPLYALGLVLLLGGALVVCLALGVQALVAAAVIIIELGSHAAS